jgi:molybdate-binding protein/DNA-binding XRE family transcriptional regulator
MSQAANLRNNVKMLRMARGWSQAELARRAGVSRAAVSAIEIERLVPSVAAALSLAEAFGCRVDALFALNGAAGPQTDWAWPPTCEPCRYWHAEISGKVLLYPVEASGSVIGHDGIFAHGVFEPRSQNLPEQTLVLASCDPASALLAAELARTTPIRLLVIPRSSSTALRLVGQNLVHAAGVHLAKAGTKRGNAAAVKRQLGGGFTLLRVARWQEGLALAPGLGVQTVNGVLRKRDLRWVGRESGSGARQCLDELLESREQPRRQARDHRGVAEAIRCGWADVGVCVRLVSEDAGLEFLSVRDETYDLCFPTDSADDPRIIALIEAVRSEPYRQLLGELPGYDTREAGEMEVVA